MDLININTTQNVELQYELAGVGDRLMASLIDLFIQAGYAVFVFVLAGLFSVDKYIFIIYTVIFFPIFIYEVLFETLNNGQTPGKQIRNIRVISIDGTDPTAGSFIIRWLFRLFEISMSLGSIALFIFLVNGKGQRLGDIAAKTTVIKNAQKVRLEETVLSNIGNNYKPAFPQAVKLTGKDIEIIKEVLETKPEDDRHGILKIGLIKKTKNAVQKKLNIESNLDAYTFLKTIIKDYNSLNHLSF